jgi:anti-sigma B factor antagonist
MGIGLSLAVAVGVPRPQRGYVRTMEETWNSGPTPQLPEFDVSSRQEGDVVLVELRGEVDLVTADAVRAALGSAIELEPRLVVADLSNVALLDSTGLGAIIGAAASAEGVCDFALLAPGGMHVRGVLSLSGAVEHLHVCESREELGLK